MKIAAAAYPLEWHDRWNEYVGKLRVWVRTAAEEEAKLLLFPEYGAMELATLSGADVARDVGRSIEAVSERMEDVDGLHASLAREFGVYICAASAPLRLEDGRVVNRARFFGPRGNSSYQDKLVPTPYERDACGITGGDRLRVFKTQIGRVGIAICYDAEFPLIARRLADAGAEVLLVPSCTETARGYWRVRIGAQARALENQFITVQSPTVGDADWSPIVETNVGSAGIYGPPDEGFPENGVIAAGSLNEPGWTYAEIDPGAIAKVRASGAVQNFAHWSEQDGRIDQCEAVAIDDPADMPSD